MLNQYSWRDSVKVKARANYLCELCGSDQKVQAHALDGDHSDWRDGVCLCAQHHWEQHPDMPRSLFFTDVHQPYWLNISAKALALEFSCHSRTVIRAAKKLGVPGGAPLSQMDKERLGRLITRRGQISKVKRCPECGSKRVWSAGIYRTGAGEEKPRAICFSCGKHFYWSGKLT